MFYLIGGLIHLFLSMFMLVLTFQLIGLGLAFAWYVYMALFGIKHDTPVDNATDKYEEEIV